MSNIKIATLGGGCFWCTEAVIRRLKGVLDVKPGYMGGWKDNPTYREVCTGTTGHAEVVQIEYDSSIISYREILEVFFATHDPTQLNRQGNDVGTQYRSVIFYRTEKQRETALKVISELDSSDQYSKPIITEVVPAEKFYVAEDYHHRYYEINKNIPYCSFVISPKVDKLEKQFIDKLP